MASVTWELPNLLADVLDGLREVPVEAETFQGALDQLLERYPRLTIHLLNEDGRFRRHIRCFVNDQTDVPLLDHEALLNDGDVITILQAISGGQS